MYWVEAANAADGVNVSTVPPLLSAVDPVTADPPCGVRVSAAPDWTGSLKVAPTVVDVVTPVAAAPGAVDTTLGGVVSGAAVVNDHE